jgi:hypothetical protein
MPEKSQAKPGALKPSQDKKLGTEKTVIESKKEGPLPEF